MEILTIITARKGSKRLPGKNTKRLVGIPLIEYTIESTLDSKYIDLVVVTSDDNEVKKSVNKYIDSPVIDIRFHRRPKHLRGDNIGSQEVIDDVVEQYGGDCVLLLQPTSPLRIAKHIDKCIELFRDGGFDSVISVKEVIPHTYYPNGAIYVFKDRIWTDNMGMFLMSKRDSIDIDSIEDFKLAEMILNDDNS